MTTVLAPPRPGAAALGRGAAVVAVVSAAVHLALLDPTSLGSLAMALMAVACLPCARQLWRAPTPSAWGTTALLDAGMLAVHAQLTAGAAHVHHGTGSSGTALGWLAVGLGCTQLLLAALAALRRSPAGRAGATVPAWPTSPAPPASTSSSRATPACRTSPAR
ncbi:hypothetical protein JOD57_001090 [Geodermatophilus bullaregiensis]|uniref:hypothetical protein n=1 Tax=Geodermatophilus bullaregiensis TaxID=1564160 RepID=UPI0019575CFC|nr:hypothetical protein [Geodermatophilus bullaregiensis]MBM7805253.1 hypothetical protein [Geodermatophilus bullaregiensis]